MSERWTKILTCWQYLRQVKGKRHRSRVMAIGGKCDENGRCDLEWGLICFTREIIIVSLTTVSIHHFLTLSLYRPKTSFFHKYFPSQTAVFMSFQSQTTASSALPSLTATLIIFPWLIGFYQPLYGPGNALRPVCVCRIAKWPLTYTFGRVVQLDDRLSR